MQRRPEFGSLTCGFGCSLRRCLHLTGLSTRTEASNDQLRAPEAAEPPGLRGAAPASLRLRRHSLRSRQLRLRSPNRPIRAARTGPVSSPAVACPSGLRSTPRKRVWGNPPPRVQIPPPPPEPRTCSRRSRGFLRDRAACGGVPRQRSRRGRIVTRCHNSTELWTLGGRDGKSSGQWCHVHEIASYF